MKKRIVCIALLAVMLLMCTSVAFALEYEYTLSNLSVSTNSVSVDVKNVSDDGLSARVYIAIYDEYNMLTGLQSQPVELAVGESTTVTKEFFTNSATTIKAIVIKDAFVPCGKNIYKTTLNEGNIEFGGDL